MSLNPIQFGRDVLDQYGRYLLRKLYYKNALRILPGIDRALFPE
jgi:hypothetical protein